MTDESRSDRQEVYQIRVKGNLGPQWSDWFDGFAITPQASGETLLAGPVVDQAALHGILGKIRNLGLPLVSLVRLNDDQPGMQQA